MNSFPPAIYVPKKLFTPTSLVDNNKSFQRPIYKPSPLSSNAFNNRPIINQGGRNDFIPTSLTVPHLNQFKAPMAPINPINIANINPINPINKLIPMNANNNINIPKLNNLQPPLSQNSIVVNGNITPRVVVPYVSNNNIINNNQPIVRRNMNPISIMSLKNNNNLVNNLNNNMNPINNLKTTNINNMPNQILPLNNFTPYIQPPKIINMNATPNTSIINVNQPQPPKFINMTPAPNTNIINVNQPQPPKIINMTPAPNTSIINVNQPQPPKIINVNVNQPLPPKIINVNQPQPIAPLTLLNNIPNTITYQNSFIEPGEQLNLKEFELLNEIGKGSFGNIYRVKWKVNQKFYAMKVEILDDPKEINSRLDRGISMRNFIQSTGCQGVVNIIGSHIIKTGPTIQYFELMELCEGDFEREIKMRSNYGSYYTEGELDNIIKQLISTLSFLQKRHITHRDIKPQNILISNGKYKLCDFGDIRVMQRDGFVVQRIRGSELYMSPILFNALRRGMEQVQHNTYKSDVFSLGMCLFYAACLSFDGPVEIREIVDMNMKLQILNKYLGARYSQKLIKILYLMLLTEESIRPDFIMLEDAILKYGL